MPKRALGVTVAAALVAVSALAAAAPALAAPAKSEHQRIVDFWTIDKVKKAQPRDFVYDEATGRFVLQAAPAKTAKPVKNPGLGSDWTGGGVVQEATGKVLFAMGGSYYVCSATATKDNSSTRTIVTTAGHCVYDNVGQAFATNWMFIPNYDATPVTLSGTGAFCDQTTYGCWTAQSLVASSKFTAETDFTSTATLHDYAFAVMGPGGKGNTQLDATVGAQTISFAKGTLGATTHLFGYPASKPYDGKRLIYSYGSLGTDPNNADATYRVASNMTQGCSGGPWFQGFNEATGTGTQMSVNSYGYSRVAYMHGPVFNAETQGMFNAAHSSTGNLKY